MRTVPNETESYVAPREEKTLSRAQWKTELLFIHLPSPREL